MYGLKLKNKSHILQRNYQLYLLNYRSQVCCVSLQKGAQAVLLPAMNRQFC